MTLLDILRLSHKGIITTGFMLVLLVFLFPTFAQERSKNSVPRLTNSCIEDVSPTAIQVPARIDGDNSLVGVYRPLLSYCNRSAALERIDCDLNDPMCIEKHGTYARDQYLYAIPEHSNDGSDMSVKSVRLVSDGLLDLVLTADKANWRRYTFETGKGTSGELLLDGPRCQLQPECFEVSGAPKGFELANGAYQQSYRLTEKTYDQDWSSIFDQIQQTMRNPYIVTM